MKKHLLSLCYRWVLFISVLILSVNAMSFTAVSADINARIQEIYGALEQDRGSLFTLKDLKKGDTIHAYMTNTSGNLDPLLGVLKKESTGFSYEEVLKVVTHSHNNFKNAFSALADDSFIIWDDDGGAGYNANLKFLVPADGDYVVFAGSMMTNPAFDMFQPTFTSGSYRLILGINAPSVNSGKGEPTGNPITAIGSRTINLSSDVEKLEVKIYPDKPFSSHRLRNLRPGDVLYVRLLPVNDGPLPQLLLSDFGEKVLVFAENGETTNVATFSYSVEESTSGLKISLGDRRMDIPSEGKEYILVAGINAPEVLQGDVVTKGVDVFQRDQNVKIGMLIEQIVSVDQRRENFTVVGTLQMLWKDPNLAFSQDTCNCSIKMIDLNGLKALAAKNNILFPIVTFSNQQGNRWSENQQVFIEPSGKTTYMERFTVTLQAPDFDFRIFPFDQQIFKVRLDLNVPTEVFTFAEIKNPGSPLGDQLGEEEWSVVNFSQDLTEVPFGAHLSNSRFTATLEMRRHLNYYMVRIIMPLLLIIGVSWVIFFLKDYGKQLEVASTNLLVFVAFNFAISNDLPRLGYLTLLDRFIITSFACAAVVVFISVYQKRLEASGRLALASYIDNMVLIFYPLVYVILLGVEYYLIISKIAV